MSGAVGRSGSRAARIGLIVVVLSAPLPHCPTAPLQAQISNHLSIGGGGAATRLRAVAPGVSGTMSGVTLFGSGRIRIGSRLAIEGSYRQGTLKPDSAAAGSVSQDLVDARLALAVRPLPWLQVAVGPRARAYVVPGSTEQFLLVEGRLRIEGAVIGEVVRTHVELSAALASHTNVPGASASARGGEAGLTLLLPRSPIWGRLTYAIDRAALGGRVETLEDVALSLGWGRP